MRKAVVSDRLDHATVTEGDGMHELVEEYVAFRVARGDFNGRTPDVARSILHGFASFVDRPIGAVTEHDIERWLAQDCYRASSRKSMIGKVRPFLRWAHARGYTARDCAPLVATPKLPKGMPRFLEPEDVTRVFACVRSTRDRVIVLLMVHLGLRRIEVSRIEAADIDWKERLIDVRGKNGQGQVTRTLPIVDEVWGPLNDLRRARGPFTGALFVNYRGEPLSVGAVGNLVVELMTAAGIKQSARDGLSAHALRHTCAQHLIDGGSDIRVVQAVLGHSSVQTTELYLRRKPRGLREALEGRSYTTA